MQLQLTRGLSNLYPRCSVDLSLDPVQNTDDLLLFYRSNPSYCVVFFAPRYRELIRRSHISLQRAIHDSKSSIALCTFISQLSSIPSATYLQCAFAYSLYTLLKRRRFHIISALAFRDDTYVFYHRSYFRSISPGSPLRQRGAPLFSKKKYTDNNLFHTKSYSPTTSAQTNNSYVLLDSFDDSYLHLRLSFQLRYAITDLKSFIQYGSKIVPRRPYSWEQIVNISPLVGMINHIPAVSITTQRKPCSIARQKGLNVKTRTPLSMAGSVFASPYSITRYSGIVLQRSGSTLQTFPPKTSRAASKLDDSTFNQKSQTECIHSEAVPLKDVDATPIIDDSPVFQMTEKFISTLDSTSLFDDQSLLTSSCEYAQILPSKLAYQERGSSSLSRVSKQQDVDEPQSVDRSNHNRSKVSDEDCVPQASTAKATVVDCIGQPEHNLFCHTPRSTSSYNHDSRNMPVVAANQCREFPNDMDIYDLDVVSYSTDTTSVALATPLKVTSKRSTQSKLATQCLHTSRNQLEVGQAHMQESNCAAKYGARTSQIIEQYSANDQPKVNISPVHTEASPGIRPQVMKREYTIIGDQIASSLRQKVSSKTLLDSTTLTYTLADSFSNSKPGVGVFDRQRLKMDTNHAHLNKDPILSDLASLDSSRTKVEGLICDSPEGNGQTYLMNILLLQHAKKSTNKRRVSSTGRTLIAPSSSRADTCWRPMTVATNENRDHKETNTLRSKVTSQAAAKKKVWRKYVSGSMDSTDKSSTRCRVVLNLEIPLVQQ